jgi:hypothetical protein
MARSASVPAPRLPEGEKRACIQADSKLVETAPVSMVVADEYGEWLLSQRGTVSADLDLEF